MNERMRWVGVLAIVLCATSVSSAPTVYPTGTTIYDPDRSWNGYTVLTPLGEQAAVVIDMNGNVVKSWEGFQNSAGGPVRILPGGHVIAATGANPPKQESLELLQLDFDGNVVWSFDRNEQIETGAGERIWSLRQHHDWQRKDFPAGYYSPEYTPGTRGSNTLVLTHTTHFLPAVTEARELDDDRILEVTWDGEIVWEWTAGEHIDEFGFSDAARATIESAPGFGRGAFDWIHINSATWLGPNRFFDAGDERFAPDNVMISSRQASLVSIIDRDGSVVWQLGPDFSETPEQQRIRQMIGQHHAHMIPKGLPGAGNILIFDNGGSSGYGAPSPIAANGMGIYARATSRILEIDPTTLELVWSYGAAGFFSTNISGVQRLPNGNTLITEGAPGRLFEVTTGGDIVWEYLHPVFSGARQSNSVYRGYRLPYAWIPQLDAPPEVAVIPPALGDFRVP
jgi:outer membrane protein assembly factor BamB